MKHRAKMKPSKDQKVFTQTAKKTKAINVTPKNMRGSLIVTGKQIGRAHV